MAEQDAVDEGADGCLFVGVEVGEGFEAQLPHVVGGGARLVVEDEFVGGGVEGEGEAADDVEGGLGLALFIAADLGDVEFDVVGELLLGEVALTAEGGEAFGEVHGEHGGWSFLFPL